MISKTTRRFWKCYSGLPLTVKQLAKSAYEQFVHNPYHPSLQFKRVHSYRPIYSVRISRNYRAVGIVQENEIIWFWVGSHADYDGLLKKLGKS